MAPDIRKYEACVRRGRLPYSSVVARNVDAGDAAAGDEAGGAQDRAGRPRLRLGDLSASVVGLRQNFSTQATIARIVDRIRCGR